MVGRFFLNGMVRAIGRGMVGGGVGARGLAKVYVVKPTYQVEGEWFASTNQLTATQDNRRISRFLRGNANFG